MLLNNIAKGDVSPSKITEFTRKTTKTIQLDEYEYLDDLAKGAFGDVKLAKVNIGTDAEPSEHIYSFISTLVYKPLVVKIIPKMSILNDKHITHIKNEKAISKLYNECFISDGKVLAQYCIGNSNYFKSVQDQDNLYFLMDYFPGGELAALFAKQRINMKMDTIRLYLAEIILSLEFLHNHNIVYRDLKLENVIIDKKGHCRLIDFGFSK